MLHVLANACLIWFPFSFSRILMVQLVNYIGLVWISLSLLYIFIYKDEQYLFLALSLFSHICLH